MKSVDLYAGRFAGSFDVLPEDASDIDHDTQVSMLVTGLVKELTLKDTRSGELRLAFVIRPTDVQRLKPWQLRLLAHPEEVVAGAPDEDEPDLDDDELDEDPDPFVPPAEIQRPVGQRVSTVQPHSNIAGSSQAERDTALARFLYEDPR